MLIKEIYIRDWRGLREVTLGAMRPNISLVGFNGQGKSSILDAVCYALLGYCRHTDRAGRGVEACIRQGAEQAIIRLRVDRFAIDVAINATGKNVHDVVDFETGEMIDLPILNRYAGPCLMPAAHIDNVADLLTQWADEAVTPESVEAAVGPAWWGVTTLLAQQEDIPIGDFTALGNAAYDVRREANAIVKREQALLDSLPHAPRPEVQDRPTIVRGIAALETRVRELNRQLGAANGMDPGAYHAAKANLTAAVATADDARKAARSEFEMAQTARLEAQAELDARQSTHASETYRYTQLEREIKQSKDPASECPTCGRKLTAKMIEAGKQRAAALEQELEASKEAGRAVLKQVTEQHEAVAQARACESKARAAMEDAERNLVRVEAELANLPVPWDGPAPELLETELAEVEERLENGRSMLEAWDQWQERDAAERRLAEWKERAERADWLVKAYRDGHVTRPLLVDALRADFVEPIAEVLKSWTGKAFDVEVDGKQIRLTYDGRPVRFASEGERALVQLAVAQAFGRRSGSPILLDDCNQLDTHRRRTLLHHLQTRGDDGPTVMVATAWQQSNADWDAVQRALDPVGIVSVENGRAVAHYEESVINV